MIKRFYHPIDLGLDELLKEVNHTKYKDRYLYVIDQLINCNIYNKSTKDKWVPLSTNILKRILTGKISSSVISNLINWQIIVPLLNSQGRKSYTVGEKCIQYRMHNRFNDCRIRTTPLTDKTLFKNLNKYYMDTLNSSPVVQKLYDCLHSVVIDVRRSFDIMNSLMLNENIQARFDHHYDLLLFDEHPYTYIDSNLIRQKNTDNLSSYIISLSKLIERDLFTFRDTTCNRVHTNITNLKKEFRTCLSLEKSKEKLVEIDICNSQPLLFNYFLLKEYENKPIPEDVLEYIELTSTGKLYDKISEEKGFNPEQRNEFKKSFFKEIFYCDTKMNQIYDMSSWFNVRFPNVYYLVIKLKRNDYKKLAIAMQKLEAKVMIDGVATKYFEQEPDGFILTVHDSIITTESNVDLIYNLIIDEFKLYNLDVTLKVNSL